MTSLRRLISDYEDPSRATDALLERIKSNHSLAVVKAEPGEAGDGGVVETKVSQGGGGRHGARMEGLMSHLCSFSVLALIWCRSLASRLVPPSDRRQGPSLGRRVGS